MSKKMLRITVVALSLILMGAWTAVAVDVPRMSKEALKEQLGDPDVIILDVRTGSDWKASEFKIKGAVRASSNNVDSWAAKYGKDKTLVFYCA
jgi:rhodanese-related sulfurtransferase